MREAGGGKREAVTLPRLLPSARRPVRTLAKVRRVGSARSGAIAVTDRVVVAAVAAETVAAEDVRASDPRTVGRSV